MMNRRMECERIKRLDMTNTIRYWLLNMIENDDEVRRDGMELKGLDSNSIYDTRKMKDGVSNCESKPN